MKGRPIRVHTDMFPEWLSSLSELIRLGLLEGKPSWRAGRAGNCVAVKTLRHAAQAEAPGLPSEAALVRQPSVAAAVYQALPDMPVPPLMTPLSTTSSESRDLPEGVLLQCLRPRLTSAELGVDATILKAVHWGLSCLPAALLVMGPLMMTEIDALGV